MSGKVIQGSFIGGQPRWSPSVQPTIAPSAFPARTAVPPPPTAFAAPRTGAPPAFGGRQPSIPPTAFAARPSGPPTPAHAAQPSALQRHPAGGAFAVEAGALGIASGGGKPLPDAVRGKMETALGADFSGARIHVGRRPNVSARSPSPPATISTSPLAATSRRRSKDSSYLGTNWRMSCSSVRAGCATRWGQGLRSFRTVRSKPKLTVWASVPPRTWWQHRQRCRRRSGNHRRRCGLRRQSLENQMLLAVGQPVLKQAERSHSDKQSCRHVVQRKGSPPNKKEITLQTNYVTLKITHPSRSDNQGVDEGKNYTVKLVEAKTSRPPVLVARDLAKQGAASS